MNHDILLRYIRGYSDQQEKEDIARWLDADEKNMREFLLLRNIYDSTLWNTPTEYTVEKQPDNKKKIRIVREFFKIAAIFLIALGCYYLFLSSDNENRNVTLQTIYAPEGQRAEAVLSDGTKVWLNAKSSLTFPAQFSGSNRIVELDGEAYFDVHHDDKKRFIVKTKMYQIQVYGTEFDVNAYSTTGNFETSLIKGSVKVVSNLTNESIKLTPNNRVYSQNNSLIVANIESQDQFLWKKGILFFEKESVKDIFKKLELYYDVKIDVRNKEILNHQYTGKFWTKDGVEHILRVLQLRHNFKYSQSDINNKNNITIY